MFQKKLAFLFVFFSLHVHSQEFEPYTTRHYSLSKQSMLTLGGWGAANILTGGIGYFNSEGSSKYFHQMNASWNTVNLALGVVGYLGAKRTDYSKHWSILLQDQHKTEKILLFNSALDLGYIGTGLYLHQRSFQLSDEAAYRSRGFGNSLIVQGSFLLIFDITVYLLHKKNRLKNFEPILLKMR